MFKKLLCAAIALLMLVPMFASSVSAADEIISKGKAYTVEYALTIDNAYPKKAYQSEEKLTDGVRAVADTYNDKAWLELYRGAQVIVTIDLEEVMAINKVTLGQFQHKAAGIVCSRYVEIYVSEDGEEYGFAGKLDDGRLATYTAAKRVTLTVDLENSYKARYVRVVFASSVNTFVDEISVYGNSDTDSAISGEPYTVEEKDVSGDIDGIKSICLMYIATQYTTQTIKPYVAYVDNKGAVQDTMFDSLLFLGMPPETAKNRPMNQVEMQEFVATVFSDTYNVGALNTVIGELKDDLGLADDYKYPIFMSVPDIKYYTGVFGEIDGKKVPSNSLEKRCSIVKWYIDYVESEFAKCNYENVELKGLYWFAEQINHADSTHESELVKYFNDYSHDKGYKTMWIPYYSASGVDEGKELGFDSVTMQCGYAFGKDNVETGRTNPEACTDAAAVVKQYGLNGMEFELDMAYNDYAKRFAKYVSAAYGAGLMEKGMMTMYQVGDHLYRSAISTTATGREVYDLTYKYCSGTYKEVAPVIKEGKTVTVALDSYYNDRLEVIDEDTKKSDLKIAEIERPEGIYFAAEGNGFFEVQTYDCKPGTYTARLSVTDGSNVSNTVEIKIIVEPGEGSSASGDESGVSGDTSGGSDDENKGGIDLWVIILIVVGVLVVAGAVIAVLKIRSSKNK